MWYSRGLCAVRCLVYRVELLSRAFGRFDALLGIGSWLRCCGVSGNKFRDVLVSFVLREELSSVVHIDEILVVRPRRLSCC